ncbi:hypothetical protein WK75_03260 [Burkholderia ubonensis]|uniref:hypothetical protein n=1 Tax=Burkholderia ubonensis TaxID=101571 RepID=UPI00075F05C8|nr:hypothetical protein [Burkholderia ubonensis]KVU86329.1 hypothetical protein WK75_03260 [Burkholderia ubonensis]
MMNSRIGNQPANSTVQPSTSNPATQANANQSASGARTMAQATLGPLAALRRSDSMTEVHRFQGGGVRSAMRISVKVGTEEPDVRRTAAYVKRPGAQTVTRFDDYSTLRDGAHGTPVANVRGDDSHRRDQSPERLAQSQRHDDTRISINDAEVPMLFEGREIAQQAMGAAAKTAPWQVEVEYHGNDGPCGDNENVGCKGRLAKASATLEAEFLRQAPAGSTFKATSVYSRFQVTTRGNIPTKYGYSESDRKMTYGADDHEVNAHTIRETRKPEPRVLPPSRPVTAGLSFAEMARNASSTPGS